MGGSVPFWFRVKRGGVEGGEGDSRWVQTFSPKTALVSKFVSLCLTMQKIPGLIFLLGSGVSINVWVFWLI